MMNCAIAHVFIIFSLWQLQFWKTKIGAIWYQKLFLQ